MYEIKTDDFYKDIEHDLNRFDTSDYPVDHPLFSLHNKKVIGMFKDECNGKTIDEFVGLRPKHYSYKMFDGKSNKSAKGVKQGVVKNSITHDDYKNCLLRNVNMSVQQNIIRSYGHDIFSETVNKVALSEYDDKRSICGTDTLAYGHCRIT
jgi:hypothetical protein